MTFHDKHLRGGRAKTGAKTSSYKLMAQGAYTITLWPSLRKRRIGDLADDWNAVGSDLRRAMREEA